MTTPTTTIATIDPSKSKTWVGLVGTILSVVGPYILSSADLLPQPWPLVIGLVFALLTAFGIYKAPYKPEGTSVVSNADLKEIAVPTLPEPAADTPQVTRLPGQAYRNPWE